MTSVRDGSRWIGDRPTGKQVAEWFIANAPMHEGMKAEDYVTGVVLIPAKEKTPRGEQQLWVPYAKVETRVAYFWNYLRLNPEWVGSIEPAPVKQLEVEGVYNMNLPPGFFRLPVQEQSGKFVHFLCCSMQVRIRHIEGGADIMSPPAGTKMVTCLTKWGVDEHAIMRAETGAVGRALGMAGMLTIPGSGIASAEDMQEMIAAEGRPSVAVEPTLPGAPADDQLRAKIAELSVQLHTDAPGRMDEFIAWATEKSIDLGNLKAHQLRGVLLKLERAMAA